MITVYVTIRLMEKNMTKFTLNFWADREAEP